MFLCTILCKLFMFTDAKVYISLAFDVENNKEILNNF